MIRHRGGRCGVVDVSVSNVQKYQSGYARYDTSQLVSFTEEAKTCPIGGEERQSSQMHTPCISL
ncbi:hypothetical protein [Porphyromonas pogonae]|uniref:hypothetical protein n=1 Tax=Porphyromonas pogonae TaxID=867595 RepID=UPI002E75BADF|nr:hypothetical protein [Porphyromonas pogonae]